MHFYACLKVMIKYKSTRGNKKLFTFSETLLKGIAQDGGLFVPEKIPMFSLQDLKRLIGKSYQQHAEVVFDLFETDIRRSTIKQMIKRAYGSHFDTPEIAP